MLPLSVIINRRFFQRGFGATFPYRLWEITNTSLLSPYLPQFPISNRSNKKRLVVTFFKDIFSKKHNDSSKKTQVENNKDSINIEMPEFLNALNLPEMKLPVVGHFCSANSFDTLDFDVKDDEEYLYDFSLFTRGDKKNALNITIASEIHVYDEGDLDGDGTQEIGIIPGYNTSACRNYIVYSFNNHKWKMLYSVNSHLADRERGIDYIKRIGDSVRILSADDG